MNARTLNCHSCGAAVAGDAPNCQHCGARLASIACPACFGMMFQDAKFCPHCGSPAVQWQREDSDWRCPSPECDLSMLRGTLRDIPLHECAKCYGLWVGTAAFERICHDAAQNTAVLGAPQAATGPAALAPVRYVRCPECSELMHRVNFARCSGVIVDVCKPHGTWFDANELHRIVHFIRAGGLDRAREKERTQLAEERRRLASARAGNASAHCERAPAPVSPDLLEVVVRAAGCLLGAWLRR